MSTNESYTEEGIVLTSSFNSMLPHCMMCCASSSYYYGGEDSVVSFALLVVLH